MAKRIFLFLLLNFLVISVITIIFSVFGIGQYTTAYGINTAQLALFCLVWGMVGALISLLLSRWMAKRAMGVTLVERNAADPQLRELVEIVAHLAEAAHLPMPEVGVYPSNEVNAFATGPSKSRSLVAVSTGLLQRMNRQEIEGVLGHELSHIANGDMVTMTLLQGVVNAFVMFLARVVVFALDQFLRDRNRSGRGLGFFAQFMLIMFFQSVFMSIGMIVVAWFSRLREFRADAGSAEVAGREKMIAALEALKGTTELIEPGQDRAVATLKISGQSRMLRLYATHPPMDERIERLKTFQ